MIKDSTKKRLWAISRNRCYVCKKEVTEIINNRSFIHGEMAHIVSEKPNGPRHKKNIDYDHISNLMILCQKDHKLVDEQIDKYTCEILILMKRKHEEEQIFVNNEKSEKILYVTINSSSVANIVSSVDVMSYLIDEDIGLNEIAYKFKDYLYNNFEYWSMIENISLNELKEIQENIDKLYENNLILMVGVSIEKHNGIDVEMGNIFITDVHSIKKYKKY